MSTGQDQGGRSAPRNSDGAGHTWMQRAEKLVGSRLRNFDSCRRTPTYDATIEFSSGILWSSRSDAMSLRV